MRGGRAAGTAEVNVDRAGWTRMQVGAGWGDRLPGAARWFQNLQ